VRGGKKQKEDRGKEYDRMERPPKSYSTRLEKGTRRSVGGTIIGRLAVQ